MDPDRDLPCQDRVELVTDYLEGRLTPMEQRRFEAHLALCRGCRTYLAQMRQTVRALGKLSDESIDPEARERLLAVFRAWRRGAA
jgi:anti-sigma factor RsiW